METEFNISLTFQQVLGLVKQLPQEQKVMLAKALEKEAVSNKLSDLLQTFRTEELSEDIINQEAEAVRQELYERSTKP